MQYPVKYWNWTVFSVSYFATVPYVPEGFDEKRTIKSEVRIMI